MTKKSAKYILFIPFILVVLQLYYINRPVKRNDVFGFYYGNYVYANEKSSFMLILNEDGTYLYSYIHSKGIEVQCDGDWSFYINDRGDDRITFYDMKNVRSDNVVPQEGCIVDMFFRKNIWGNLTIPLDDDAGMILFKQ